jgi:hypothetical protein
VLSYKVLQKYGNRSRHWGAILFPQYNLFNSNFPGAASGYLPEYVSGS